MAGNKIVLIMIIILLFCVSSSIGVIAWGASTNWWAPTTTPSTTPSSPQTVSTPSSVPAPPPSVPAPSQLPSTIDKVRGYTGDSMDLPSVTNQTEESCRQMALAGNGQYVAWGYRNSNHATLKNTCLLYKYLSPYNGNPNDTIHTTGCLRDGQRVSNGCR